MTMERGHAATVASLDLAKRALAGDVAVIDALACDDAAAWESLLELLVVHSTEPVAPPQLAKALLERRPRVHTWVDMASRAVDRARSLPESHARRVFLRWLCEGVVAAYGPTAPASLEARTAHELFAPAGARVAEVLVSDARDAGATPEIMGRALVLHTRRLLEESQVEAALAPLLEAEELALPQAEVVATIRRLRGGALLRLQRFDDAFAILDSEMVDRAPVLAGTARNLGIKPGKLDHALDEAATIAQWASATTPEWIRALGGIEQHASAAAKRTLGPRFLQTLCAMVDASTCPGQDLEVVIRQAGQRGLRKTAKAATDLAREREIEVTTTSPHFG